MSALRSACLTRIVRSGSPFARAASMKSDASTSSIALRVIRDVSAIMPSARATAGRRRCRSWSIGSSPCPKAGSQPSQTAKMRIPMMAVK